MKRLSLYLFLILFILPTPSQADDIRDFQIEGMSIGDSALDYFTKDEMEKYKSYYPKSKKWVMFAKSVSSFETYDSIQVHFKDGDSKYIIGTLDGSIHYKNNIKDCYKKMDEVENEISKIFKNAKKKRSDKVKHSWDKSGKSIVTDIIYRFESGDVAILECVDWSDEIDFTDNLTLKIGTKEFINFLQNEAYK